MRRSARRAATPPGEIVNAVMVLHGTGGSRPPVPRSRNSPTSSTAPASRSTSPAITSSCPTISATAARRSRATACGCASRTTIMTTWSRRSGWMLERLGVTPAAPADGHVDGLHARLRLGRDPSRFRPRDDADGLPAGRDRRPQPDVAPRWRSRASAAIRPGRTAITPTPAASRACAPPSACSRSPASRRSICSAPIPTARRADAYIVERDRPRHRRRATPTT